MDGENLERAEDIVKDDSLPRLEDENENEYDLEIDTPNSHVQRALDAAQYRLWLQQFQHDSSSPMAQSGCLPQIAAVSPIRNPFLRNLAQAGTAVAASHPTDTLAPFDLQLLNVAERDALPSLSPTPEDEHQSDEDLPADAEDASPKSPPDARAQGPTSGQKVLIRRVTPNGPLIRTTETATLDTDGSCKIKLFDGKLLLAVLFSEVFVDNEDKNKTALLPSHQGWTDVRGAGRPDILYKLNAEQGFLDGIERAKAEQYTSKKQEELVIEPWLDGTGRVIVNPELKPLRFLLHLPHTFSSEVPGWYLEALFRLDPVAKHEDIIDRMPSTNGAWRPSTRTLHQRRARHRHIMRITNWQPTLKDGDLWEQVIKDDLDAWALANNSTARLVDLSSGQINLYEALQENPRPVAGKDKAAMIARFRDTIQRARDAGYMDNHKFIADVKERIKEWQKL